MLRLVLPAESKKDTCQILFSDESRFVLSCADGHTRAHRRQGECYPKTNAYKSTVLVVAVSCGLESNMVVGRLLCMWQLK